QAAREEAISYAAYRVLKHRYQNSEGSVATMASLDQLMTDLNYSTTVDATVGSFPAAVGNRVADAVIAFCLTDDSNEVGDYADTTYAPMNDPLILDLAFEEMDEPNHWQPLAFAFAVTQNGLEADLIQTFIGSNWGVVRPFALDEQEADPVYFDPGVPPELGGVGDAEFKQNNVEVIRFSRTLDPDEGTIIDISPGSIGNNPLGTHDGTGYALNPHTNLPYAANTVNSGDFGRVIAEFWADGPDSETPPGHWNTLANEDVVDSPFFEARIKGDGPILDPLEWDVKMYFAINGAVHDAAIAAWGCKREYDYVRPISSIRQLCLYGQSSDTTQAMYHPLGITLEEGLVEVISADDIDVGEKHHHLAPHVGKIAIYCWGGEPADPDTQYTGNEWILGIRWLPYQRDTFVTPAFAGYISGHSTFSRAAAEVLTCMTGSPFFPGGIASYTEPAGGLEFELGPTQDVTLQWATYYDAADQAGISRIYGGIHVAPDDGPGRIVGSQCGIAAWNLAEKYFDGSILGEPFPIEITQLENGDLLLSWDQVRGFFHAVEASDGLGGWTEILPYTQAGEDRGTLLIPAGSEGLREFYRGLRTEIVPGPGI
ncbi:MAG: vanadium-dependent haloperoxidase, partial [Planctomycetota bacterium]